MTKKEVLKYFLKPLSNFLNNDSEVKQFVPLTFFSKSFSLQSLL
jgi:hypothetical protein